MEEVGDFRPDVFGVFAVCLRDVAYDADEWVVAGVDDIVPVSCGTLLHIQEIPLEFPPDELEKEQCAQGEEQADAGDKRQHDPRGADGRVNAGKTHAVSSSARTAKARKYSFARARSVSSGCLAASSRRALRSGVMG